MPDCAYNADLILVQYYIFGTFNAVACIHMFLTAPETKGFTLEEMEDVFNSGLPAWKKYTSDRLEQLEKEIQEGNLKVNVVNAEAV